MAHGFQGRIPPPAKLLISLSGRPPAWVGGRKDAVKDSLVYEGVQIDSLCGDYKWIFFVGGCMVIPSVENLQSDCLCGGLQIDSLM